MRRLPLRSPPRMRGKVWLHQKPGRVPGITPAYAGKSLATPKTGACTGDHPRVCGEKSTSEAQKSSDMGSPPRVRGKGPCRPSGGHLARITPACAGKSSTPPVYHKPRGDHPRVCGEKSFHSLDESALPGSPPRVRGKASFFGIFCPGVRITPACAGKSLTQSLLLYFTQDHPRVCGEK